MGLNTFTLLNGRHHHASQVFTPLVDLNLGDHSVVSPRSRSSQPLAAPSVSVIWATLSSSYKWHLSGLVLLRLAPFAEYSVPQARCGVAGVRPSFLLQAEPVMCAPTRAVDGCSGGSRASAAVRDATGTRVCEHPFETPLSALLGIVYPEREWLGCATVPRLLF